MELTQTQTEHIRRIFKIAQKSCYAVAVKDGLLQFQTVIYNAKGTSTVTPITGWISVDEAEKFMNDATNEAR